MLVVDLDLVPAHEVLKVLLLVALLANGAAGDVTELGIGLLHGPVYLVVFPVVDRTVVLIAYLHVLQREWRGMAVPVTFGAPAGVYGSDGVLYGVEEVLDIVAHIRRVVQESAVFVPFHPFRAHHSGGGYIHGVAAEIFAELIELVVAESVGAVVGKPLAPGPRAGGDVPDGALPVVHRGLVDAMDEAAAGKAQERGMGVGKQLCQIGTQSIGAPLPRSGEKRDDVDGHRAVGSGQPYLQFVPAWP